VGFVLAYWRPIAALIAVAAVAFGGWYIKGRFDRAAEADRLERVLDETTRAYKAQVAATFKADQERLKVSKELAAASTAREAIVKEVVRAIRQMPSDPRCSVPVDVVRRLNAARGYELPEPPK
jgi:hypothetical protein